MSRHPIGPRRPGLGSEPWQYTARPMALPLISGTERNFYAAIGEASGPEVLRRARGGEPVQLLLSSPREAETACDTYFAL